MKCTQIVILLVAATLQFCVSHNEAAHIGGLSPEDLLKELEEVLNKAVNSSITRLESLKDDFHKQVNSSIENSTKDIEEQRDHYLEKLDKLKKDGTAQGKDVEDCVEGKPEKFQNVTDAYQKKGYTCGEDKKKEGDDIIDDVIQKIKDTHNDVLELNDELRACGSGVTSLVCKGKVAAKISIALTILPAKIASNVLDATRLIGSLYLGDCTSGNLYDYTVEGDRILYDVRTCIANKPVITTASTSSAATTTEPSTENSSAVTEPSTENSSAVTY